MGKRLLGIVFLATLLLLPPPPANELHVLDVGQGDAILISTEQGHSMLVDGGSPGSVLLPLSATGTDEIDILVVTHYDSDHAGGIIDALRAYQVNEVWLPTVPPHTETAKQLVQLVYAEGSLVRFPQAGDHFSFDDFKISVLSPDPQAPTSTDTATNDQALVLGVSLGTTDLFLTSDAPASRIQSAWERWLGEKQLQTDEISVLKEELGTLDEGYVGVFLPLEILKVGHHGSRTSTTPELLANLQPQLALISVGARNKYKHPAQETLQALNHAGIPYQRTDQQGTINLLLSSDGQIAPDNRPPGILAWIQFLSTTHPRTQLTHMLYFWHAKKIQTLESANTQSE